MERAPLAIVACLFALAPLVVCDRGASQPVTAGGSPAVATTDPAPAPAKDLATGLSQQ
jgi:hypothetical protein